MSYPEYINNEPQTITLKEYDVAPWASTTCLDFRGKEYVVVVMENPDNVVAKIDQSDYEVLDKIFKNAMETHEKQKSDGTYNSK